MSISVYRMSDITSEVGPSNLDEDIDNLSHEDLLEITQSSVKRLIASDPLLSDLPVDVTPEEVVLLDQADQTSTFFVINTGPSSNCCNTRPKHYCLSSEVF